MISEITFNSVRAYLQRLVYWPIMLGAKNIKKMKVAPPAVSNIRCTKSRKCAHMT
jgi:hypothetical protein